MFKRLKKAKLIYYGHPILHRVADPIEKVDGSIRALSRDLVRLMKEHKGVGLAAPQVGVSLRIFVMMIKGEDEEGEPLYGKTEVFINPTYRAIADRQDLQREGCLSIPSFRAPVVRPFEIEAEWVDLDFKPRKERMWGWRARCFLHEFDHLNGVLFPKYLMPPDQVAFESYLEKEGARLSALNHKIDQEFGQ